MLFMSGEKGDCNTITGQSVNSKHQGNVICFDNLVEGILGTTLKISCNPLGKTMWLYERKEFSHWIWLLV